MSNTCTINSVADVRKFIFAGRAIFTVKNNQTGNRFTFKVIKSKNKHNVSEEECPYWVKVLTMADNTDNNSFKFIGVLSQKWAFSFSKGSPIKSSSTSVQVALWYFKAILDESILAYPYVITYHMGRCGRCGKLLTVPESIVSGYGEECMKMELAEGNTEPVKLLEQHIEAVAKVRKPNLLDILRKKVKEKYATWTQGDLFKI